MQRTLISGEMTMEPQEPILISISCIWLSKYDASLRDLVIRLSLDLEHFMKVKLNDAISDDPKCDGYDVVASFMTFDKNRKLKQMASSIERKAIESYCSGISESLDRAVRFRKNRDPEHACKSIGDAQEMLYELVNGQDMHYIQHSMEHLSDSAYSRKLACKYGVSEPLAAWNYIEMASFGSLIGFLKYYFFDYGTAVKERRRKIYKIAFVSRENLAQRRCPQQLLTERNAG